MHNTPPKDKEIGFRFTVGHLGALFALFSQVKDYMIHWADERAAKAVQIAHIESLVNFKTAAVEDIKHNVSAVTTLKENIASEQGRAFSAEQQLTKDVAEVKSRLDKLETSKKIETK